MSTALTSAPPQASTENLLKAKVLAAAAKLTEANVKVNTRMDERETSNGVTRYFQFECDLQAISQLQAELLEGLIVTVTVAAYAGSYQGKDAVAASQAANAANAFASFASFGGRR